MSLAKRARWIGRLLLPPIITEGWNRIRKSRSKPLFEYAPRGWKENLPDAGEGSGWNAESVASTERARWEAFCRNVTGTGPLGFSHEYEDLTLTRHIPFHNVHITYAYVLALAAHRKTELSVLDWGGGLGHYYLIGKSVLPDVTLDFHCKEVPVMAEAGQRLNPKVKWYRDDTCLERTYDLVMINGSLQYIEDWKGALRRLAAAAAEYLFLTRLPVVEEGPSFVAIQHSYNTQMLHQQLNQAEVLKAMEECGFRLVREFVVGDRPYIQGAPEQCELRGWLFKRAWNLSSGLVADC